jgi:3-methyl-2-oxobutanoate hydroxymethyltransferase
LNKVTTAVLQAMKRKGEKITMLTASDYPMAAALDEAGVDILLVGDSLGMVVLGYDSTLPVTMDVMVHHTKAVVRGTKRALVISDLPFMSYQASVEEAVRNAGRLLQEAGAHGVKLEGGREVAEATRRIVAAGISASPPNRSINSEGTRYREKRTQRHGGSWRTRRSWRRRGPSP